jgi:ABC-type amino acid transport system permease subunit
VANGAVTIDPLLGTVAGAGLFVTATLIALALRHRMPLEQPKFAPIPLTVSGAVLAATIFAGPLPRSAPAWVTVIATLTGLAVGAIIGHRAANALLDFQRMPTTAAPAPPSADRYPITRQSTAVWTGRLPALRWTTWLLPLALIASQWWMVRNGIPVLSAIVLTPFVCVTHALGRANRRLRVTIGPSGMQLRSGLFNHLRQSVGLELIAAASITEIDQRRILTADWHSTERRLTISTRRGPALRLSLADHTELVISMGSPSVPAGVINSLLDQRATLAIAGRASWGPPC